MKEIKLIKKRAKTEVLFKTDKEDNWFIWIIQIQKKSGKESKTMIIKKDLDIFLNSYLSKGWEIIEKK